MAVTEQIELLGKHHYKATASGIPETLTLQALPTISELEYVSAEDFNKTMIEDILPKSVKESINFGNLLEVDYYWVLRCLRILNYGPYFTTNAVFCPKCGRIPGEYKADLRLIDCIPLPEDFKNSVLISRDEFLDFKGDIEIKLLTIKEAMMSWEDTAFLKPDGMVNRKLSRECYMVKSISGETNLSPIDVRIAIEKKMSPADFMIFQQKLDELTNYGLRSVGPITCPKCHNKDARFIALIDDRFFRPTLGDLQSWKNDRSRRKSENTVRNKTKNV